MVNKYSQTKIKTETKEKLKQLIRLESVRLEKDVTLSEVIEDMMEESFKKFDKATIEKIKNNH